TRLQLGALLEAEAAEPVDPSRARQWRRSALWLGWVAALVGDESTLDFPTPAAPERVRGDMRGVSRRAARAVPREAAREALLANDLEAPVATNTSASDLRRCAAGMAASGATYSRNDQLPRPTRALPDGFERAQFPKPLVLGHQRCAEGERRRHDDPIRRIVM